MHKSGNGRGAWWMWAAPVVVTMGCEQDYKLQAELREIEASPSLLDFGHVATDTSHTLPVTLTSLSGGDVQVIAADLLDTADSYFSVEPGLPTIPQDGDATLTIHYSPEEPGWHTARLTILTDEDDNNAHVVDLRGHASASSVQIWPTTLDFGPVNAGEAVAREVFILNDGDIDTSLDAGTTNAPLFTVNTSLPLSILIDETGSIRVAFTAATTDLITDDLRLSFATGDIGWVSLRANDCASGDPTLYDTDGDGWSACAGDCDDSEALIHSGATERCDGIDQDCDDVIDEGTECYDDDGDGLTENRGDCNDGDATISPSAPEVLDNGVDDDCDGVIDLGTEDLDGDGYLSDAGDCDDSDPTSYLGAPELVDGIDNNCDGRIDDTTIVYDDDGDGWSEVMGDCDDGDRFVSPSASESPNWVDDDCDGPVDEGTPYGDDDGDGYSEYGGDCDDSNPTVRPGAIEVVANFVDDDCDGTVE